MKIYLTKTQAGFVPADPDTETWYRKRKFGEVVEGNYTAIHNYEFFKKYFALLRIGFDNWTPAKINSKYGIPAKNFERFRKDVAILCGFYEIVIRLDGTAKPEALSISFAKMEEEEFQKLYSQTIDVFLERIYDKNMTAEELDETVNKYLGFA